MSTSPTKPPTSVLTRSFASLAVTLVVMAVLLFWPAGTLAWPRGWWFLAVMLITAIAAIFYLWRVNPEIFAARSRFQPGSKRWDVVVASLTIVALAVVPPLAALDDARFHWFPLPDWVVWLGYLLFFAGFGLIAWAQAVNRHFEPTVRIQTDRNHQVIDTGPYAVIRHPGYIGAIPFAAGVALALGSLFALIPVVILKLILIYRTLREEETLRAELPGYTEYTQRVKFRWVPGLW